MISTSLPAVFFYHPHQQSSVIKSIMSFSQIIPRTVSLSLNFVRDLVELSFSRTGHRVTGCVMLRGMCIRFIGCIAHVLCCLTSRSTTLKHLYLHYVPGNITHCLPGTSALVQLTSSSMTSKKSTDPMNLITFHYTTTIESPIQVSFEKCVVNDSSNSLI